ncbi:DUF2164 domain-containing protein [Caulobacter sp. 17J65-9]|uniref:DUF2164 domain-containing protein n=1 Tax=Caulobacter sp. 17J65-9 TaxID=2709382 RepID=UPI0013C7DC07|nr:DUF2164 domain-containing protein [Caulobacter sp. 17J65-9]NEX92648.1 DUF2164 domain-containing protein [Caulobacter sp. 17J65-9]
MSRIEFDPAQRALLARKLSAYLARELDVEVGGLAAGLMLDFLAEELGPHFYNQGLHDAQALFRDKWEQVVEAVYEIEKPVKGR